jgi:hypothetical protein
MSIAATNRNADSGLGNMLAILVRFLISLFNRSTMFVVRSMRLWATGAKKTVKDCGTVSSSQIARSGALDRYLSMRSFNNLRLFQKSDDF